MDDVLFQTRSFHQSLHKQDACATAACKRSRENAWHVQWQRLSRKEPSSNQTWRACALRDLAALRKFQGLRVILVAVRIIGKLAALPLPSHLFEGLLYILVTLLPDGLFQCCS